MEMSASYTPSPVITVLKTKLAYPVEPAAFPEARLRYRNTRWAREVGLDGLSDDDWTGAFARFEPLPDNLEQPLALAYHGHQFGVYNPEIGDGRGFLFAQLRDRAGRLLDLGTKGSGQTPFSRTGDGRLTLKGGVREVLATAMLEALGVYTSKTFSLIETGEALTRGDEPSPTRSSVLVRLQHSHIRFGTFQRLAYLGEADGVAELVQYCAEHYYPDTLSASAAETAPALLAEIASSTAAMIASWMAAGFVHGVMNTDNMVVTGESFDYGPYRFLPSSEPNFVAAYFDQEGLYRFGQQPTRGLWNLQQLAGCLTLVAEAEQLEPALKSYAGAYADAFRNRVFERMGLETGDMADDTALMQDVFAWMTQSSVGWDQFFFDWLCGVESIDRAAGSPSASLYRTTAFASLRDRVCERTPVRPERLNAAYFQGSRPHTLLIDEIEDIWSDIADRDDWRAFSAKMDAIETARTALELTPRTTP